MRRQRRSLAVFSSLALILSLAAPAMAANPANVLTSTGQSLSIEITSPAGGSVILDASSSLSVTGTASIGPLTNSGNVIYAVDVSRSTLNDSNQDCNGDGLVNNQDDFDGDGLRGSTLDCEIAGVIALNQSLATAPGASGGLVAFGAQAAIADVDPAAGVQIFTSPLDVDKGGGAGPDLEQVARSLEATNGRIGLFTQHTVGSGATNYDAALTEVLSAFSSKAGQHNTAFFMSDGIPSPSNFFTTTATSPVRKLAAAGVRVNTYSIGRSGAGCGPGSALKQIADITGGTCAAVADPSQLSTILLQPATIQKVELRLNGGAPLPATLSGTDWSVTLPGVVGGIWNTLSATVTASDGATATAEIQVYGNRAPVANAGAPVVIDEGSSYALNGSASDPDGDAFTIAWTPSTHLTGANTATPIFTADDDGIETLTMTVTDIHGMTATATTSVTVRNVAPTAMLQVASSVNEGDALLVSMTGAYDPSPVDTAAGLRYAFACSGGDLSGAAYATASLNANTTCTYADGPSTQVVRARIIDKDGGYSEYTATVTVMNVAPSVGAIAGPSGAARVGMPVTTTASFSDPGVLDTHTALWDWGDGTTSAGTLSGSGQVGGSHTYAAAGLYTVTLTVTDKDGGVGSSSLSLLVVDPDAGFVTGGGWINTPEGKANISINAKYQKNRELPTGQTQFKVGQIDFHSTGYEWLLVAGDRATYVGTGKINGAGSYGFLLSVIDGPTDMVRMKIWDQVSGTVVYDTQPGAPDGAAPTTALGGGSVVIH